MTNQLLIVAAPASGEVVLTTQHMEEELSLAYVHALAGRAGINVAAKRSHDYGVDGTFCPVVYVRGRRTESGVNVDFQLKATVNWVLEGDHVVYDLEVKTFNDLVNRAPEATPLVLIVLCLHPDQNHWLTVSEKELVLKNCGYWYSRERPNNQQNILDPKE